MLQGDSAEDVPWSVGQAGEHPRSSGGVDLKIQELAGQSHGSYGHCRALSTQPQSKQISAGT